VLPLYSKAAGIGKELYGSDYYLVQEREKLAEISVV
jgi:hypothetical protein